MKATELINQLQKCVNENGDFDLKVGYCDNEISYSEHMQPEDVNMSVYWDERDNHWHGGWLLIDREYGEVEEED